MANVKISALPGASALAGTEAIPLVQSAATRKSTPAAILTYVKANSSPNAFAQTATVTVANSGSELTLLGSGVGSLTVAGGSLAAGSTLNITATGIHSAVANPTLRIRIYLGSTVILDTGAVNTANSTNAMWQVRALITCRTAGAGGTVIGQGSYLESGAGANVFGMSSSNTAVSLDTTADQILNITAQFGAASPSNSISCSGMMLQTGNAPS